VKKELAPAFITYLFLLLLSFTLSIYLGFGKGESSREISSFWYYARRGYMILTALTLPWFSRRQTLSALGWKLPWKWIFFAIVIGVCMGTLNRGGFDPRKPETIPLALFHTFSMEVFFRGYLYKTMDRCIRGFWKPIIFSSLLYALFYQTMWTTWVLPPGGKIGLFAVFTFLGVLFAFSYKKSGSLLVNWTMHICAGLQYRLLF
jgi:hypothetical protein